MIAAGSKKEGQKERVRERMLLMQMLLKTDPHLPANLTNLSAVEMRRASDDDANPWVATIVAIAVEDEPSMDGLVRLLTLTLTLALALTLTLALALSLTLTLTTDPTLTLTLTTEPNPNPSPMTLSLTLARSPRCSASVSCTTAARMRYTAP